MASVRQAATVAASDLRRRLRSRSALVTAFVAPVALAVVFGSLVGSASSVRFEIGVVASGDSEIGGAVASGLVDSSDDSPSSEESSVRFVALDGSIAQARDAVDADDVDAALVLGAPPADSGVLAITVVADPDREIAAQVAEAVASSVGGRVERASLGMATVAALDEAALSPAVQQQAQEIGSSIGLEDLAVGGRQVSAMAYYGAGMAILLLFFTVGAPARAIIVDRQTRTLDRMLAGPVEPAAILGGYVISAAILALAGFVTVWLVTTFVFDARWGPPVSVMALIVATVAAIAGVATFVGSLARTDRQADTYTAIVAFVFAMLGGNFLGPSDIGAVLSRLKLLTPNGWSLDGFVAASADDAGVSDILAQLGVLSSFAVFFGGWGLWRVQRSMVR